MIELENLPGLLPDEKMVKIFRRHPVTLFGLYMGIAITFIIPLSAYFLLRGINIDVFETQAGMTVFALFLSVFFLYSLLFMFQQFLDHWLDVWILTTRRIINIEQTGLFSRVRAEVRLYRVQDVTSEINGFLRHMFNYGMVYTQTAGERMRFTFEDIMEPKEAAKMILQLAERDQRTHEKEITSEEPDAFMRSTP
ncbi:MAG: PH domain-containing protein [Patescibacteria group bacterium]|nr:PH domain-containing protein [Patescibacteria group bacterium]